MDSSLVDLLLLPLTVLALIGCGLMAGTFLAFSNFVMKALARIPAAQGMTAMQSINIAVLNSLFLSLFLGAAAACVLLAACSLLRWQSPAAIWLLTGSVLYVVGNLFVTMACNVPRNSALARVDASDVEASRVWREYVAGWTKWNHVRTITALAAAAALTTGLCQLRVAS